MQQEIKQIAECLNRAEYLVYSAILNAGKPVAFEDNKIAHSAIKEALSALDRLEELTNKEK
jgi:hypothetical protein